MKDSVEHATGISDELEVRISIKQRHGDCQPTTVLHYPRQWRERQAGYWWSHTEMAVVTKQNNGVTLSLIEQQNTHVNMAWPNPPSQLRFAVFRQIVCCFTPHGLSAPITTG